MTKKYALYYWKHEDDEKCAIIDLQGFHNQLWTKNGQKNICDLLNEQYETIQRLKQNIDELLSVNVEEELLKENEQLKSLNKYLIELLEHNGATIEIEKVKMND